ncbi:putative CoA-binding protein [Rhizobium leguminosarum]|uniref:hypothetical protein n=1 Tax=Rhizobium leguminosarum TaxID=384 RepID=UPI00161DFFA0|nr:hypothetical protein [Rhizobium leguminosarum]MBB4587919.1 putative CoA-binding protein [Rhizobium leguminosarum]
MAQGKMVVLKPVVWNDMGYRWPAGRTASSGYTKDNGYGHEEWNGRDDWVWEGWKVFHTEAKGEMYRYAGTGRLGIIMTAMNKGQFFAMGVGCNVFRNSEEDAAAISEALDFPSYADRMWKVDSIRKAQRTRAALDRHWLGHTHVAWRCPMTHYAWFGEPVPIIPHMLIPGKPPRQAIVKMHSSYQAVRPDQALSIVLQSLPDGHSVVEWLSTDDFDQVRNRSVRDAPSPGGRERRSASTSEDLCKRYLQENEIVVSPLHAKLQGAFAGHLATRGIAGVRENVDRVDLRYRDPKRGAVLVEVKPTEPATVRFAIRAAMGQLLDYQQHTSGPNALLIVIDDEPTSEDARLALSNGFGLAWRNGRSFEYAWPTMNVLAEKTSQTV